MPNWTDRQGREIEISSDGTDASAHHNGHEVGRVSTTGPIEIDNYHSAPPKITGMDVDEEYRGAGIGLRMIKELFEEAGEELEPADKNVGRGGENALTDEGLALTRRAQKAGYVLPFADEVEPHDSDDYDD